MNPTLIRFLPPSLVLVVAVWCGWPCEVSTFEDLPTSVAKAARWKAADLQVDQVASPAVNPFAAVLQSAPPDLPTRLPSQPIDPGPPPPTSAELLAYIQLDGFGAAGGQQWAILNGRPRSIGDVVLKAGRFPWPCRLSEIAANHVVLQCGPTRIDVLSAQRSPGRVPVAAAMTAPSAAEIPPPPPIITSPPGHDLTSGAAL